MIIAIDGPAGTGKSTIAKMLSEKLNITFLNSGGFYRTLTMAVLDAGIDYRTLLNGNKSCNSVVCNTHCYVFRNIFGRWQRGIGMAWYHAARTGKEILISDCNADYWMCVDALACSSMVCDWCFAAKYEFRTLCDLWFDFEFLACDNS